MSRSAKWAVAVVFGVAGAVVLVFAVIYVTVPIHQLPGFVPGGHPGGGTYHKRGAVTGLVAVVLLAIAVVVGLSARRTDPAPDGSSGSQIMDQPEPDAAPSGDLPGAEGLVSSSEDHSSDLE
ncbi:MAG TPA: hypothetical protein VFC03_19095 [Acidimicrobiales bacterium]|jgi:hypothetical protein|nr:hypothetical protein [Acidimicrobiales bacterium]